MVSVVFLVIIIVVLGKYIDKVGCCIWLIWIIVGVVIFGLVLLFFFENGIIVSLFWFLFIGMGFIGMGYGLFVSFLFEFFLIYVCYLGVLFIYNIVGLFGVSVVVIIVLLLNV